MPWPVGAGLGVIGFAVIRYGIGWWLAHFDNPYLAPASQAFTGDTLAPFAWLVLGICWIAALFSYLTRDRSQRLQGPRTAPSFESGSFGARNMTASALEADPSSADEGSEDKRDVAADSDEPASVTAENIANLSWLQFEHLIAASFRCKGFTAELTPEGADEGADIALRERDKVLLVQCKHWSASQVGVNIARELFGVMHAKSARKAVLVTSGRLTAEAQRFCRDNSIYWLDADRLPGFVDPSAMPPRREIAADRFSRCPLCGASMVVRTARQSGRKFRGCTRFPACRGRRFAGAFNG